MMTTEHSRIALDPAILAGKPVIRGTRLSVEFVIGLMADGWKEADIMTNYPGITHDDVMACLAHAPVMLSAEERDAISRSKTAAERYEFATDEQVKEVWTKHGL